MELRHLRYFVAIAEERSFTRAAEGLWVAQPGLSTQVRRLETELGVKLLDRHTRGVDLTPAGALFLERARAALAAADAAARVGAPISTPDARGRCAWASAREARLGVGEERSRQLEREALNRLRSVAGRFACASKSLSKC